MFNRFYVFLITATVLISATLNGQTAALPDHPWYFLDTKTIGSYDFIQEHPTYDGRGVVIIICDSGVDMGVPGLLKTSEGKVKIIDARDFSGQGTIPLEKAKLDSSDNEIALVKEGIHLTGFHALDRQPADSIFWIGAIDEAQMFKNSAVTDINNNGKTDDIFGFVTFPVMDKDTSRWVYYLDEDGDGNLNDEKARFDYKLNYDTFTFRGRDTHSQKSVLTFVLNIFPEEKEASFHACDNPHGTHCAGISAGFQIFGEKTQHGIAPGAQVISCKIGDGTLSGGATTTGSKKRAFEYGVKWANEHDVPVVFSMSYGIGSEEEGRSDIETFLNNLMAENENILVVVSNGNSGPGLSATGNPAGASRVISAGALLSSGSARDSYGFVNQTDRVFHFSSRGGELDKPDVLTVGCAAATVPGHSRGENMWGTSMACPQLSGAAALLISACLQEGVPFNGPLIKRSLKYSAIPLPDYTHLDQGTGVVNIPKAFKLLKRYAKRNEKEKLIDYEVETFSPQYPDGKSRCAYWRTGIHNPQNPEKQRFTVKAIFPKEINAQGKADFYRAYNLKSDQNWLNPLKSSTYIRGDRKATINVQYDYKQMTKPGVYVGTISAYPKSGVGKKDIEFQLINTVIVPHHFNHQNNFELTVKNKNLTAGEHHRYFVLVPPGASAMHVTLESVQDKFCQIYAYIHDPAGRPFKRMAKINPAVSNPSTAYTVTGEKLMPGIWEIIPFAYYDVSKTSYYNLKVNFDGIECPVIDCYDYKMGENPQGNVTVFNQFHLFQGTATGAVNKLRKNEILRIEGDSHKYRFKTGPNTTQVQFQLSMDIQSWQLFTDVAANIKNTDGKVLQSGGFSQKQTSIQFNPKKDGEFILEIIGAMALPEKTSERWEIELVETHVLKNGPSIELMQNKNKKLNIYPGIPTPLQYQLSEAPIHAPKNFELYGELFFQDSRTSQNSASIPVIFE
ncbi:S8 family serine peptidase [bacterium]|nr:S8 family serine peptidase [bacterium]